MSTADLAFPLIDQTVVKPYPAPATQQPAPTTAVATLTSTALAPLRQRVELVAGEIVGRLTLLVAEPRVTGARDRWLCRCACGTTKLIDATRLRTAVAFSCGCFQSERREATFKKHGHSTDGRPTPTYVSWANMKDRCLRPGNKNYAAYGGSGIKVCERWMSFDAFLEDMGELPKKGMTIERADNAKGYEPGNCTWASRLVQSNNRRMCVVVIAGDDRMTASQFARLHGLPSRTFRRQLSTGIRVFAGIEVQAIYPKRST